VEFVVCCLLGGRGGGGNREVGPPTLGLGGRGGGGVARVGGKGDGAPLLLPHDAERFLFGFMLVEGWSLGGKANWSNKLLLLLTPLFDKCVFW